MRLSVSFRHSLIMEIPLGGSSLNVGSEPGNGLVLSGEGVAPRHLVLRRRGRRWMALALDGQNVVNETGQRARRVLLCHGTSLSMGEFRLRVTEAKEGATVSETETFREARVHRERPLLELHGPEGCRPRSLALREDAVTIGRDPGCDMVVDDPYASLRHVRIQPACGCWIATDLGSCNGTWIEGRRVDGAELAAGARLCVGRTVVDCRSPATAPSSSWLVTRGLAGLVEEVDRAARTTLPVLLVGESGTGKEGLARRIHDLGPRSAGPFVPVNCASLPETLADSILFGHARGAFTGAVDDRQGLLAQSAGGTVFLDEIGELAPASQARLLRVLEDRVVRPLGSSGSEPVDLRVVAATNRDLEAMVRAGDFRLDLYHRIAVLPFLVPPLRDRPGDVIPLVDHLLDTGEIEAAGLSPEAVEVLAAYRWPGNVRELKNVMARAGVLAGGATILPEHVVLADGAAGEPGRPPDLPGSPQEAEALLREAGGNVSRAARMIGAARSTLRDRLRRLGVARPGRPVSDGSAARRVL